MKIILIIIFGFISFNSSANFKGLKLIQNVSVVDVENEEVKKNKDILIKDQKIVAVLPHLISLKSNSIEIINAKGQFATPGLIDMHVHLDLWHYGKQADDWSLPLFIANGITTVRDAAGSDLVLQLRKEITDGSRIGPKMIIASPFMTSSPVADDDQNTIFIKSP